jgi:hypothetical protein
MLFPFLFKLFFNSLTISLYFRELNKSKEFDSLLNNKIVIKNSNKTYFNFFKYKVIN